MSIPSTKQFRDTQYHVSECGKIFNKHNKQLAHFNDGMNYHRLSLYMSGKKSNHYIHRIVAEVYLGIPSDPTKTVVNHIDGDPSNNNLYNLEWATYQENSRHAVVAGLWHTNRKQVKCPNGNIHSSIMAAARFMKVHRRTIQTWINKPNHGWSYA